MAQVVNVKRHGGFMENSVQVLLARVTDDNGDAATSSTFSGIQYEVWDITTPGLPEKKGATHTATVANVMFDTLQKSASWTVDDIGYNFALVLAQTDIPAAAKTEYPQPRQYAIDVEFTTTGGNVFVGSFQGPARNMLFGK